MVFIAVWLRFVLLVFLWSTEGWWSTWWSLFCIVADHLQVTTMAGNNPTAAPCANGAGNNPTAAAPFVFAAPFATGGAGNNPTGLPCAVASVKGRMACCDNSRRGVPCAIRASVKGRMVCCDSLDKFGPGAGRKRTPEEVALGIQEVSLDIIRYVMLFWRVLHSKVFKVWELVAFYNSWLAAWLKCKILNEECSWWMNVCDVELTCFVLVLCL